MKKPQSALDQLGTSNRSEFLADSPVIISPLLVSVNTSSEADPPTSRNVAVTHLPIDGNVDAENYPREGHAVAATPMGGNAAVFTESSPRDGHAIAAASMDDSAATFTDSSAAASMDGSVTKKQKRCKSRAKLKKKRKMGKVLLKSRDPAYKEKKSAEMRMRRELEKSRQSEQDEARKATGSIPQLVSSPFTFNSHSSFILDIIFNSL